jgi:hypothetical protein
MASKKPTGFAEAAVADAKTEPSPDKLVKVKEHVKKVRSLSVEIEARDERTTELKAERYQMLSKTLPDMFVELGIKTLELEPEGNYPAFVARAAPYYKANIAADWPDEKRAASYDWLRRNNLGDIIKTEFVIELGRGTAKQQKALKAALKKLKIPFSVSEGVSHSTLTAIFKDMVEKEGKVPPLDVLGASMGTVVSVREIRPATTKRRATNGN